MLSNPDARLSENIEVGPIPTATVQSLQKASTQAWLRSKKRIGDRVYLQLTPQVGSLQRAEISPGSLVKHNENVLGYEWIASAVTGFLTVTRRPWWERARAELALDNGSAGGPATGGVTVYNHDDGGANHDNWVDLAGATITGAVPRPVELQLTNTQNVNRAYNFHVAHNVLSDLANLTHIFEVENASTITSGAKNVAATASNGNYVASTVGSGAESRYFEWPLSMAILNMEVPGNPGVVVVSDAHTIRIHTNFSNSVKRIHERTLDDLLKPSRIRRSRSSSRVNHVTLTLRAGLDRMQARGEQISLADVLYS